MRSAFCDQEIKTKVPASSKFLFVAVCTFGAGRDAEGKHVLPKAKLLMKERREKGHFVTRNFKRKKRMAHLRYDRSPDPERDSFSCQPMIGHTQRPVIRCWLVGSTRICDAQVAPPTLPSMAALASPRLLPFRFLGIQPIQGVQRRTTG